MEYELYCNKGAILKKNNEKMSSDILKSEKQYLQTLQSKQKGNY